MEVTPLPQYPYSPADLATAYNVSLDVVYREIRDGRLRAVKVRGQYRIAADAVSEWGGALVGPD